MRVKNWRCGRWEGEESKREVTRTQVHYKHTWKSAFTMKPSFVQLICTNENKDRKNFQGEINRSTTPEWFILLNSSQALKGQNDSTVKHRLQGITQHLCQTFDLILFFIFTHSDANISTSLFFLIVMGIKARSNACCANTAIKLWPEPPYFFTFYCCILLPDRSLPQFISFDLTLYAIFTVIFKSFYGKKKPVTKMAIVL